MARKADSQKKQKVKKTKVKGKLANVTQKVIVNVSKGSRAKRSSGPPQPSQAERIIQSFAPLLSQRQPLVQSQQPLQQSQVNLQSLENILKQLIPKDGTNNVIIPPISIPQVPSAQRVPLSPRLRIPSAPPSVSDGSEQGFRTPSIDSESDAKSLPSFAFDFSHLPEGAGRGLIADQPDSPLVQPAPPLVSNAPQRLDLAHEDVPLEAIGEEPEELEEAEEIEVPNWDIFDAESNISFSKLDKLPVIRKANTSQNKPVLREIAGELGIRMPRGATKNDYIDAIMKYYNRSSASFTKRLIP